MGLTGTGGAGNDCTALRSQFSASVMLNLLCTERQNTSPCQEYGVQTADTCHGGYCIDVECRYGKKAEKEGFFNIHSHD